MFGKQDVRGRQEKSVPGVSAVSFRRMPVLGVFLWVVCVVSFSGAVDLNTFGVVTNQFSDMVSIVDLTVDPPVVVNSIPVGDQPIGVAVTPDGSQALICNVSDGTVTVLDLTEDPPIVSSTIPVGGTPSGVSISPDGTLGAVSCSWSNSVSILDLTVSPPVVSYFVPLSGAHSQDVGITTDGQYALTPNFSSNDVSVIDLTVTPPVEIYTINIGDSPIAIGIDPTGNIAVVPTISNDSVSVIDLTKSPFSLKATVSVGDNPGCQPDISLDGTLAVVGNSDDDTVSVIDLTMNPPAVITTLNVGRGPRGVGIINNENKALVANREGNSISIIDLDLNPPQVVGDFSCWSSPSKIAVFESEGGPDLTITSMSFTPTSLDPNQQVTITYTVENIGTESCGGTSGIGFYLSDDGTIELGDIMLGEDTVPDLNPGESHTITDHPINVGNHPGNWNLGGYADWTNVVTEYSETNNAYTAGQITINSLWPDVATLSKQDGGQVLFELKPGIDYGSRIYFLLGSMSGTSPGILLPGGNSLLLNKDIIFDYILKNYYKANFIGFRGITGPTGEACALFDTKGKIPNPLQAGSTLYFAFTTEFPYDFQSNPVEIEIVP